MWHIGIKKNIGHARQLLNDGNGNDIIRGSMEEGDIKTLVGPAIFQRAADYFHKGMVWSVKLMKNGLVRARVYGSTPMSYYVTIDLLKDEFYCSCPYEGLCKHIGAVLLYLHHHHREIFHIKDYHRRGQVEALRELAARASTDMADELIPLPSESAPHPTGSYQVPLLNLHATGGHGNETQKRRFRLVFCLNDPYDEECTIRPALQYIRHNGGCGRITNFNAGQITEPVSEPEARLLMNHLVLQRHGDTSPDSLAEHLPVICRHPDIPLVYQNGHQAVAVERVEIRTFVVGFELTEFDPENALVFPVVAQINGGERLFLSQLHMGGIGGAAYVFDRNSTLYYSIDNNDLATLVKLLRHMTHVTLSDIAALKQFCSSMSDEIIKIDFNKKAIRIITPQPTPLLILEPYYSSLIITFSFSYEGIEINLTGEDEYLPLRSDDTEEFKVIRRNPAFEDEANAEIISLISDAPGFHLDQCYVNRFAERYASVTAQAEMTIPAFLHDYGPRLTEMGVRFKVPHSKSPFGMRIKRLVLRLNSDINWFEIEPRYRENGKDYPLEIDPEYFRYGFVKTDDGFHMLTPHDIELIKQLMDCGLMRNHKAAVSKKDLISLFLLFDMAGSDAIEGDVDEATALRHVYEKLQSVSSLPDYPLPEGFHGELRPYQKIGYNWLHFMREHSLGACLADDMGLGKTIQTLALLQSLKSQGRLRTSLIVVPLTTMSNWLNEIQRFTPHIKALAHHGPRRDKEGARFGDYDIILTSYQTLQRDAQLFSDYEFYYIILDEAQHIKNSLSLTFKMVKTLQSEYRLSLSGTPIENSTFELWSHMEFLNPGILGKRDDFKRRYSIPIEKHENAEAARLLRRRVSPFILRRTKEEVAKDLPQKEVITIYVDMTDKQRELYDVWLRIFRSEIENTLEKDIPQEVALRFFRALQRLRQLCIFPELFKKEYAKAGSGKFEQLKDMIDELMAEKHKVICYSQFTQVLAILRRYFDQKGIAYLYLDGKTKDRESPIRRFQEDDSVSLFLISLKAGGLGINLTAADYVILFDPWWNPAVESQAIDRAHRIGRRDKVIAYRLITKHSIEEKIEILQNLKKRIAGDIIPDEKSFFKALTPDEIRSLLT